MRMQAVFTPTRTMTVCPWKGKASYFTVDVEGVASKDAAWTYKHPLPLAREVRNRVAFWGGIEARPAAGDQPCRSSMPRSMRSRPSSN